MLAIGRRSTQGLDMIGPPPPVSLTGDKGEKHVSFRIATATLLALAGGLLAAPAEAQQLGYAPFPPGGYVYQPNGGYMVYPNPVVSNPTPRYSGGYYDPTGRYVVTQQRDLINASAYD